MGEREYIAELLSGASDAVKRTCAALVGEDARSVGQVAEAEGVSPKAIYERRRRLERKLGVRFPRMNRIGRPIKPQQTSNGAGILSPAA